MPRIVVRKGYRCQPGKRRELLAALQRVDAVAAEAGWPRGRYLFIETKSPGEPDVEVEFTFESYGEMEQLERRLREHLGRNARDAASIGSAGQEFLLEPSSTRYLLLLDDGAGAAQPRRAPQTTSAPAPASAPTASSAPQVSTISPAPARPPAPVQPAIQRRAAPPPQAPTPIRGARPAEPQPEPDFDEDEDFGPEFEPDPPPDPYSSLTPAERRQRQLADARAALSKAEDAVNVSPEQRARARQTNQRPPVTD